MYHSKHDTQTNFRSWKSGKTWLFAGAILAVGASTQLTTEVAADTVEDNVEQVEQKNSFSTIEVSKEEPVKEEAKESEQVVESTEVDTPKSTTEEKEVVDNKEATVTKSEESSDKEKVLESSEEVVDKKGSANKETSEEKIEVPKASTEGKEVATKEESTDLENEKNDGLDALDELSLTAEEYAKFENQIMNATSSEDIEDILWNAERASEINETDVDELEEMIDEAINLVDELDFLTEEQRGVLLEGLEHAETIDDVVEIVNESVVLESLNAIDTLDALTEEQRETFKNRVRKIEDLEDLEIILEEAEAANEAAKNKKPETPTPNEKPKTPNAKPDGNKNTDDLSDLRKETEESIKAFEFLTSKEKADLINRLRKAKTIEEIEDIFNEAFEEDAINEISGLSNLTDAELEEFINRILEANSFEEIEAIVDEAFALSNSKLEKPMKKNTVEGEKDSKLKEELNKNLGKKKVLPLGSETQYTTGQKELPKTGEKSTSLASILGLSLLALVPFAGKLKKEQ